MVSQLSICFLKLLWHGRHGLRVVPSHSRTDHVSVHNAVYFWPCTAFGENWNAPAWSVFWFLHLWVLHPFPFLLPTYIHQKLCNSITFRYFPVLVTRVSLLCVFSHATWTKLPNKWTYYLGFNPFLSRFTWSPYLDPWQQFQNILTRCFSKMLVRGRERDLAVEYQNIKNPIIIAKVILPRSIFSHFWGLGWDRGGNGSPRLYLAGNSEGGWCRHASKSAVYHDPLSTADIYLNMLKSALIFLHCHICPVLL